MQQQLPGQLDGQVMQAPVVLRHHVQRAGRLTVAFPKGNEVPG
jgi:hypothetical protein